MNPRPIIAATIAGAAIAAGTITPANAGPWDEIDVNNTSTSYTQIYMRDAVAGTQVRLDPGEDWVMNQERARVAFPQAAGSWKKGYPGQGYGSCLTRSWLLDHNWIWDPPNLDHDEEYTVKTYRNGNCTN